MVKTDKDHKFSFGGLSGTVREDVGGKSGNPIGNATITVTLPAGPLGGPPQTISVNNDPDGYFEFERGNPAQQMPAGIYEVRITAPGFQERRIRGVRIRRGQTTQLPEDQTRLKRSLIGRGGPGRIGRTAGQQGGLKWLDPDWLKENWIRLLLRFAAAIGVTILMASTFYWPFLNASGLDNAILKFFIPLAFFFIVLATIPSEKGTGNWVPFIIASALAALTFIGIGIIAPPLAKGNFIQFGLPLVVYLISYYTAKQQGGPQKTFARVAVVLAVIGGGLFLWNLVSSGKAFEIETYLKPLDVLRLFGVSQGAIDNMKENVRNVLSFLQFKAAEPVKPEAKKFGGFEAIDLKFGSGYNDYILPPLFARDEEYNLPVTIINPNEVDSGMKPVTDFYIDGIYLNNRSEGVMCGEIGTCGKDKACTLNSEQEVIATLDFKGLTKQSGVISGTKTDCRTITGKGKPLASVEVTYNKNEDDDCEVTKLKTDFGCDIIANIFKTNYGVDTSVERVSEKTKFTCVCELNRFYNIMDELCFMNNDKAEVELTSHFNSEVEGKGELILVQKESDRKSAPKPTITSGAGPLTVTTYFITDVYVKDTNPPVKMFIQIENDGSGSAKVNYSIDDKSLIDFKPGEKISLKSNPSIEISKCSPVPRTITDGSGKPNFIPVLVDKDGTTITCDVGISKDIKISGSYLTVPVIVDLKYSYSQEHSKTLNVKKASIPNDITDPRQIAELEQQFEPLPYYCPSNLEIYPAVLQECGKMSDKVCQQNLNRCNYVPPVGAQTQGTCTAK
ncbi:MAG: carboxypeptidase regulatory-like domain-containing protein [Candidatus Aenigmarchaeota archaeon]|nr:carboxypeptidase regulatory-like domain-containing protein [Candidatus Aenigmarchaeota archaeon]